MNRVGLLLSIILCSFTLRGISQEMPIIAYWGVPEAYTSEASFRTFSECGFTVSLFPYSSVEKLSKACQTASKFGVRILGGCPEIGKQPAKVAQTLRSEKGFFGYFMQDEPSAAEIRLRQKEIETLRRTDSTHCFYINLLPYYADWVLPALKAKDYPDYLRVASATHCQQLSFDYYPIETTGIRENWYHNLEMVRRESVNSGKPFWGFVLSMPHAKYPQPTMASLRLQVYANLAYGAQAIQYFTYWTPDPNPTYDFHDAPIGRDGRKTKTYALVQQMNQELRSVARLFYGARITSVAHLGVVPQGTSKANLPPNLRSLRISSAKGAVISQMEKNGHTYLAIVNKDYKKKMKVYLKAGNTTPRHLTKQLQEEPTKSAYTVGAGDILLFRLK